MNISVSCGISETEAIIDSGLRHLYRQAQTALEYKFIKGRGSITFYNDILNNPRYKIDQQEIETRAKHIRTFLEDPKARDYKEICSKIIFSDKLNPAVEDFDRIKVLFGRYASAFADYAEKNPSVKTSLLPEIELFYARIQKQGYIHDYNQWITTIMAIVCNNLDLEHVLIRKAKMFVKDHYMDPISLNETAEYLNISKEYLCRLFTKQSGKSFTCYLNEIRIQKAIDYLNSRQFKTYEVAEKVGFSSKEYFNRVFKSITGKSPKEYSR